MHVTVDLPVLLRRETADLHRQVERDVGLPHTVRGRTDYVALLERLRGFHAMVEAMWFDARWERDWASLEIDLALHQRTPQLASDLVALGVETSPVPAPDLDVQTFGEVLGSLYVVEGSSLGGQILAPQLRSTAGDVPTSFFESEGRHHPKPWRAVKAALAAFEERTGDHASVVAGARVTFVAFGAYVGRDAWSAVQ